MMALTVFLGCLTVLSFLVWAFSDSFSEDEYAGCGGLFFFGLAFLCCLLFG